MSELAVSVLEGVVIDDSVERDRFCQEMVESTTEFDWEPGHPHSLPEHLRDGLRRWAEDLKAWDRKAHASSVDS